ncbi:SDR family oxidoreductase [Streptosporangium sp. NPDC001559]|uniref:SDR family oxidoreductase n=1 Tax=Streptosporangium sp. NPDC001559 TaxID=3366187 RepID=UPI0036E04D7D
MRETRTDTQVIVVGAGPVGLMLAGELRLGGADVMVLERLAEPTTESRASTLHARTMEIFDSRDLLKDFAALPNDVMGHFGGVPLDLTLPGPYPGQWKAPQVQTEEVLQRWALSLGADLRRGHELRDLTVHRSHVEAEVVGPDGPLRVRGLYLVGCDGEQSTVRRLTGVAFPGREASRELLRADVDGVEIPNRRFQRLPGGLAIAARRGDGVTRVMVHEFGREAVPRTEALGFAEVRDVWLRVTGEDIGGGTPRWVDSFGDASRQVTHYRQGRVLFAGDAAHQKMPVGGQALNLGLQDAVNLGWKLALEVAGKAPAGLLDSYHEERHAVGARVLEGIRAQAMLLLGGSEVEAGRAVLGELTGYERVRRSLAEVISGLGIRYDVGPGDHPLLGARVPPADYVTEAGPTSTAALLRPGRGLLLDLSGEPGRHAGLRRLTAPWADRVNTVAARTAAGDAATDGSVFLVRPDGYIAWAETSGAAGLRDALERWFGRPASLSGTGATSSDRRGEMDRFVGKTALVTGASRGIGREIASRLAREGALVAVHYSGGGEAAEEVVASIEKDGGRAFTVQAEFGLPGDVHELFLGLERGLKERTGSVELNILVNNAGVMGGAAPEDTTPEQFDRLFAVNAKAPFFIIRRALTNLAPGGRVINVSSGLTRFANPNEIAYAMTKGAVEQLALHFAKLLAPRGITINSVAPGITRNGSPVFDIPEAVEQMARLSAFDRVGEPRDIADVVAFLASDDARWVTGAFIDASGGTLLG